MKRILTLCAVITIIALISLPALAEVQNVKVSGDIKTVGAYRNNYDLFNSTNSNRSTSYTDNDNRLITSARLRVDADLTDNVSATLRMISEWEWDTESNTGSGSNGATFNDSESDLLMDLANVTLKEVFYQPLTVIVGRQELNYQNGFIIGDPDTNALSGDSNIGFADLSRVKSFDAIRAILDYNPLVIDLIYAKIDETGQTKDDQDLYGINAAYDIGDYNATVEGFWYLSKDENETAPDPDNSVIAPGHEIYTFGIDGAISPVENLNLTGLFAWQKGDYDNTNTAGSTTTRDQDAYAFEVAGDYAFPDVSLGSTTLKSPVVRLGWTHFSGEEQANGGDQEAWIPLYEDRSYGVVANYILSGINGGQNSNADILSIGGSVSPLEDLTVSLDFYKFWLDEKLVTSANTALTNNDPTNYVNLTDINYYMNADDDLGYEIDLTLNYDYTEDVKMGLSAGWFEPGDAFDGVNGNDKNNETAVQVLGTLEVAF